MMTEEMARRMMRKSATRLMELADNVWWVDMHIDHDMSTAHDYEKLEAFINGFGKPNDPMLPEYRFVTYQTYYSSIYPPTINAVRRLWGMLVEQNEEVTNG